MTLRRRFTLLVALQTALLLLVLAGLLFVVLQRFLAAGEAQRLSDAFALVTLPEEAHEDEAPRQPLAADLPADVHLRIVRADRILTASPDFPPLPTQLPDGYSRQGEHQVLVRPLRVEDATVEVQLAIDLLGISRPLGAYLRALAVTVPLMILLAALAAYAVAGRLLAPIRSLERAARRVGGSVELRAPLPNTDKQDELGSLARTLQDTFQHLADAVEREQAFTRAAAHDLRSPLTALRTRIQTTLARPRNEADYRRSLQELDRDVGRLNRLTEHLLLLARDEGSLRLEPVDLAEVAAKSVDRARSLHPAVTIGFEAAPSVRVRGDAVLLAHLLDNLLDNAVLHGRGAGVRVEVWTEDQRAVLRVRDEGPGVRPEVLARLGEPFYRPDGARSGGGSGLGLAIVKQVAQLHGAETEIVGAPGSGFAVSVGLPRLA